MKTKVFFSAVFVLVMMVFVFCCSQDEQILVIEDTSSLTKEQVVKEVMPVLQGFLNAQYDYMTDKDKNPQWDTYLLTGGDSLTAHLKEHKYLWYLFNKSRYTEYTSELKVFETTTIVQSGDVWVLDNLSDYYSLIRENEETSRTRKQQGKLPYQFVVQKVNGEWRIVDWKDHNILFVDRWTIAKEDWPEDIYQKDDKGLSLSAATFPPVPQHLTMTNF
jgi:hypothetical protein